MSLGAMAPGQRGFLREFGRFGGFWQGLCRQDRRFFGDYAGNAEDWAFFA